MTIPSLIAPEGLDHVERLAFYRELERREQLPAGTRGGWRKHSGNPVIGPPWGTCFDMSVVHDDRFRMWFSWRDRRGIAYCESQDGVTWTDPQLVLGVVEGSSWEADEVNRPSVILHEGRYRMWYSGQMAPYRVGGVSVIGYAESEDGIHWERRDLPVLVHGQAWEEHALMCPDVMFDEEAGLFRMWYSAGDNHEPHSIGYAESDDGIDWRRPLAGPVLEPDPTRPWTRHKVVASHVLKLDDWFYMFHVGHAHEERGAVGLVRSRTGLGDWEPHPDNPLVAPSAGEWDDLSVYKPFVLRHGGRWMLWYNGARFNPEHWVDEYIGLATLEAPTIGW